MATVGLSIGSTACSAALWTNGRVEVIANDQGERTTPAVVGYTPGEVVTGEAAAAQRHKNLRGTASALTRRLGETLQLRVGDADRAVPAEEALGHLVARVAALATEYAGQPVGTCVLGVPARFSEEQRAALLRACELGGVPVARLLPEPVATAIAFGLDEPGDDSAREQLVAVVDVGGGSADVSLLRVRPGGLLSLEASASSDAVSGEALDDLLVDHFDKEFARRHGGSSVADSARAAARLRAQCERAKCVLSKAQQAPVAVDSLLDGHDLSSRVTRARFEDMGHAVFRGLRAPVAEALAQAGVAAEDVDRALLVGGCARMPRFAKEAARLLPRAELVVGGGVEPDEAVATGACIEASLAACDAAAEGAVPVTALPLWLRAADGDLAPALRAGASLPASARVPVRPAAGAAQESVALELYEGQRPVPTPEALLARLVVPAAGLSSVEVSVTELGATLSAGPEHEVTVELSPSPALAQDGGAQADADAEVVRRADKARELRETEDEEAIEWLDSEEGRAAGVDEIEEWFGSESEDEDESDEEAGWVAAPIEMD